MRQIVNQQPGMGAGGPVPLATNPPPPRSMSYEQFLLVCLWSLRVPPSFLLLGGRGPRRLAGTLSWGPSDLAEGPCRGPCRGLWAAATPTLSARGHLEHCKFHRESSYSFLINSTSTHLFLLTVLTHYCPVVPFGRLAKIKKSLFGDNVFSEVLGVGYKNNHLFSFLWSYKYHVYLKLIYNINHWYLSCYALL